MTCPLKEHISDYYLREKDDLTDFKIDQTVVLKEKFLKSISDYNKDDQQESTLLDWYPYVNSYYPYTEDVDAVARVSHLLATKPSFASLSSSECRTVAQESTLYSENSAQLEYLESNPTSFIILGKPGIGEEDLGKYLAEHWNCVYINPEVLIEQEIDSGSRAGQCIEFNLRCGRAIGIDVILRLIEKRVKSESAKHRGFVICGLPLIPNELYEEDPISSESAVFTVKEIFEEVLDTTIEIGIPPSKPHVSISSKYKSGDDELDLEEEEEKEEDEERGEEEEPEETPPKILPDKPPEVKIPIDVGPDFDICEPPDIGTNYEDQLDFLFDLIKSPFLIIYLMCSTPDVIDKRDNYRFDIYSRQSINLQTERCNKLLFTYFSNQEGHVDIDEIPEEFFETSYIEMDNSGYQHLVKLPRHFPANVSSQLDLFHYTALRFIERRVLMHDPQYFLKLDGRTNVQRMLHVVKSRLNILPLQNVLVPSKLNVPEEIAIVGEEEPHEFKTEGLSFDECFMEFRKRQVPSIMFKWRWSDWGTKCPVAMKEGIYRNGDPNYAVRFMNKMYFLSDEDAFIKFYRNPRPYLLPPFPKPSSRVFIFGPKFSGKSEVAACLGYFLKSTVISSTEMLAHFLEDQEEAIKEKIRQAAIAEALQILNKRRVDEANQLEDERAERIRIWLMEVTNLVEQLVKLLHEEEAERTGTFELSSFRMVMRKVSIKEMETEAAIAIATVKEGLENLNVPYSTDVTDWQTLLNDKIKFLHYLPDALRTRFAPIPATVFDDFVVEYAENAVANADLAMPELNNKNLVDMVKNNIKAIEDSNLEHGDTTTGWIVDGMLCNLNLIQELYPDCMADEIIVLTDDSGYEFLIERFKSLKMENVFREYRNFFMSIGKPDAAWRCPSVISTKSYKTKFAHGILSELLEDENTFYDEQGTDNETKLATKVEAYRQDLLKFDENYREVKQFFLEHDLPPLEIKVTNKTIPDVMTDVITALEVKYKVIASPFTEDDRAEEVKDILSLFVQDVGEGGGDSDVNEDLLQKHRRYGDTNNYCPVTFHEKWVLWKGKDDFAVKFEDKVYMLSTAENMEKFLTHPKKFITGRSPKKFPPPRICVVGIPGIGKTTISKIIADNFGVAYFSFESLLKKSLDINDPESLDELRRDEETDETLYNYLNSIEPLPDEKFDQVLCKLWFEFPSKKFGFVLDDFPKRPSDIELMTKFKLIPDLVIHLTNTDIEIRNKLMEDGLSVWQTEINQKRLVAEEQNKQALLDWESNRKTRFEELIEERREQRYSEKRREIDASAADTPRDKPTDESDKSELRTTSQVSFDSVAEQEDIDEVNRIVDSEYPELIFDDSLETLEEATERLEGLITDIMTFESEMLKHIKDLCDAEMIPFTNVMCNFDTPEITKREIFLLIDPLKYRSKSLFERCYDVSMEVADRLLSCGYFLLSKFGKTCPVQYHENKNPIQMFTPMVQIFNVFPVIHRNFIYYIAEVECLEKFKQNPLKYVTVENFNFPLIPFKVAITGPPKCGKTILAHRIANEWGLKYTSRGQAARYVLTYIPLSNLANNMEDVLRKGWELTDEMVAKCLEAVCFDSRAVTQGIVFDGFPNTITEVKHMSYVGMVPNLVIDLHATTKEIFECLSNDTGKRGFPRYSERFIDHLLSEWSQASREFREWFDREYQVTAKISIKTSNWSVMMQAKKYINSVFSEIKHYYIHVNEDWPLRLANMQVTPLEFLERQSSYKSYCPCCLHFSNSLQNGGEPPDRTGLIQFRKYFYWLCPQHVEQFLKMPEAYIPPYNKHALPQYLPVIVHLKAIPLNVFENGKCIVCFKTKGRVVKGSIAYAVDYINAVYLFDTKDCMMTFMRNPLDFSGDIDFNPPENYPALKYADLPPLGMLEQYVAKPITKALSFITRRRPIIPGLSIRVSAAIGIGLFLKVHFANISDEYKPFYKEADDLYHERRTKLINYLDRMKSIINPYLHYEEPMPEFVIPPSVRSESESTESVNTAVSKIVSEIVDGAMYD